MQAAAVYSLRKFGVEVIEPQSARLTWDFYLGPRENRPSYDTIKTIADYSLLGRICPINPVNPEQQQTGWYLRLLGRGGLCRDKGIAFCFSTEEERIHWAPRMLAYHLSNGKISFMTPAMLYRQPRTIMELSHHFYLTGESAEEALKVNSICISVFGDPIAWWNLMAQPITEENFTQFSNRIASSLSYGLSQTGDCYHEDDDEDDQKMALEMYQWEQEMAHQALQQLEVLAEKFGVYTGKIDQPLSIHEAMQQAGYISVDDNLRVQLTEKGEKATEELEEQANQEFNPDNN